MSENMLLQLANTAAAEQYKTFGAAYTEPERCCWRSYRTRFIASQLARHGTGLTRAFAKRRWIMGADDVG
jgi:hypothetical protein